MQDKRAAQLKVALDSLFPQLSNQGKSMLAEAIVRFVDKAIAKKWRLELGFDLGALKIDRSTELSRALRGLRGQMPAENVLAATRWSRSKLTRIEAGDIGISMTDMLFLLDHYGHRDEATRRRFLALHEADRKSRRQ